MDTLARIISANIWRDAFDSDLPARFISGICVSSGEEIKGSALIPEGVCTEGLPVPFFLGHRETLPVGCVLELRPVNGQVVFTARIGTGFLAATDIWTAIKARKILAVSVDFDGDTKPVDRVHRKWKLRELSLVDAGADPGARITRCWERSPVGSGGLRKTIFWEESSDATND